jgi:hypothetical protein
MSVAAPLSRNGRTRFHDARCTSRQRPSRLGEATMPDAGDRAEGGGKPVFSPEAIDLLLKDMNLDIALSAKTDKEIAGLLRMLWDHATIASATGAVLHQAIDRLWRASGGPMTREDEDRVMDAQEAEQGP